MAWACSAPEMYIVTPCTCPQGTQDMERALHLLNEELGRVALSGERREQVKVCAPPFPDVFVDYHGGCIA